MRHAHSARHEHRTARNRRFTVVVECPIAVARGAIHQKRSAVDFNIAVGINTITLGIKHNLAAIDLDETIRIACTRCATLPARSLATALHATLDIGGLIKVARSLTRLATLSAIVARKLGRGRTVLLPCALRRRILLLLIRIGIGARRTGRTDRTIGLGCIRARLARRSARRRIRIGRFGIVAQVGRRSVHGVIERTNISIAAIDDDLFGLIALAARFGNERPTIHFKLRLTMKCVITTAH